MEQSEQRTKQRQLTLGFRVIVSGGVVNNASTQGASRSPKQEQVLHNSPYAFVTMGGCVVSLCLRRHLGQQGEKITV